MPTRITPNSLPVSNPHSGPPLALPEKPDLRYLKDEARDLRKAGAAATTAQSLFLVARRYGFASWPKLKTHVESLQLAGELKLAIDENNLERVKALMTRHPELHSAPLGYGKNGPLTWAAECRVPWEPPGEARLSIARWMLEHGSDVHQGGDGPLMRAALMGYRIPMMRLLLEFGADVNAEWAGYFPILFAPCETVEPKAIRWLLEHGANPNCAKPGRKSPTGALDYVISTYSRSEQLAECIDVLAEFGATGEQRTPAVLLLLRNRLDELAAMLDEEPALLMNTFAELDFGTTGRRALTLRGATLLHVAAEYGNREAVKLLLDRGANVNARAAVDASGVGGQAALFHAVTQFWNYGLPVAELLLERGADVHLKAKLPAQYDQPDETIECTALGYAERFPGGHMGMDNRSIELLKRYGATE